MEKLELGTRIRIVSTPREDYEFFKAGDEATVSHIDRGTVWADFDEKYGDGNWCVNGADKCEFEVIAPAPQLTHAEYYERYGELTEERISDLLDVYTKATKYDYKPTKAVQDLLNRVRQIDEAAADYLVQVRCDSAGLLSAFNWADSPQGADYWGDIAYELGEIA